MLPWHCFKRHKVKKERIDEIGVALYWWFLKLDPWGSITLPNLILWILEFP